MLKAVDTVAQANQKQLLISNIYHQADKERHAIEVFLRQRCDALIVDAKMLCDAELTAFMERLFRFQSSDF